MSLPSKVKIVEVGPRDGLQNEKETISAEVKIELVDRLTDAGFVNIEAASFVSPKWVPQMATSTEVMDRIRRKPGVVYSALTPNMKGFEAALAAKADEVVIFGAASEAFSQRNINCSIAESIERFRDVAQAAKQHNIRLRGSISCSFGCPYQGEVPADSVADVVRRLRELGCDEIDIADTIGVGTPRKVQAVMERVAKEFPIERLSGHFHDTYGQATANIYASLEVGISIFHSSVAGLGGCPYAKGATGNVSTEDVLFLLNGLGIDTGIDLDKVVDAGQFISQHLGRKAASRTGNAIAAKRAG
ncbi:hydroxymethylglutaryl-CoA lyase [Noviherbaspirillum sp. CPCC 100848]|uniref:hydroxymethylglutaryl-CoA lyase n=1 Tax=Noviherbaspirillum album TaxID=3080276 RepID=A0ABU6J5S5_9BURK|nr:hydroxymethylglutaryl-CoA lyase [Noviherbaspirillum sp. CPCC 100848]MEC4718981.1 hydroxymethylglutaryl-CoA lyase [Noviherbaspirillum sp. CPCC 100848]